MIVKLFPERFSNDFMFQLSKDQFEILKSQSVTSSWGGRRTPTKDGTVRWGAQQVIIRRVEALERNGRSRTCFDVTMEDLNAEAAQLTATTKKNFEDLGI